MAIAEDFHDTVLPLVIFFILCNVVRFFGNIVVLYVYSLKYPRNHHRMLVLVLSVIDMTACLTTVPIETVSTWHWFDYPSSSLCKARMFFIMFIGLSALFMLFVTAVYKYRRICKPFGKQVTRNMITVLCSIGVFSALVFGTPVAILFDVNRHSIKINNKIEEAQLCEVNMIYKGTQYPAVYRHCVAVYSSLMVTTIVLYCFVAKTTFAHFQRRKESTKRNNKDEKDDNTECESSFSTLSESYKSVSNQSEKLQGKDNLGMVQDETKQRPSVTSDDSITEDGESGTKPSSGTTLERHTKSSPTLSGTQIRAVLIMVIIAGIFSVTFLMGLSFGYVFALRTYEDYASLGELAFLFACYRLYFINYALNPVVYFTLDRRFRKEVLEIFTFVKCAVMNKSQRLLSVLRRK